MFDQVQRGWLDGDDYRVAVEAAGVVELPGASDPADCPDGTADAGLGELLASRWEDSDPPGVGR
ncbi:MAG TPA: hypothetical protein VFX70_14135 [Mycobacteriales bacterium]|nr:hypothetical protein [Mycobacteriales bacterium]